MLSVNSIPMRSYTQKLMEKIIIMLQLEQQYLSQVHTLSISRKRIGKQVHEPNLGLAKYIYKHEHLDEIKLKEHSTYMNI